MAPEILKLESYNEMVDIWTVGILLYELFHNIEPFKGETPQDVLVAIMTQNLKFDKHCPKEARDLIKYILNIDKNYRPKISQILNHPYFREGARTPANQSHSQPPSNSNAAVLRMTSERMVDVQAPGAIAKPSAPIFNQQQTNPGNLGSPNNKIIYSQPLQYGANGGLGYQFQDRKPQDGQSYGQAQSTKHIPAYDLFENSQRNKNPLRSTGYTVQIGGNHSIQAPSFQASIQTAPIQVASFRAENEKRPPSYTPISISHSHSTRHVQKNVITIPQGQSISSSNSNASPENRIYSQPSPQIRGGTFQLSTSPTHLTTTSIPLSRTTSDQPKQLILHSTPVQSNLYLAPSFGTPTPQQNLGYSNSNGAPLRSVNPPSQRTFGFENYQPSNPKVINTVGSALLTVTKQPQSFTQTQPATLQIKGSPNRIY